MKKQLWIAAILIVTALTSCNLPSNAPATEMPAQTQASGMLSINTLTPDQQNALPGGGGMLAITPLSLAATLPVTLSTPLVQSTPVGGGSGAGATGQTGVTSGTAWNYRGFTAEGGIQGKSNFADWMRTQIELPLPDGCGYKMPSDDWYKDWWFYYFESKDTRNPAKTSDPVYTLRVGYTADQEKPIDLRPYKEAICVKVNSGVPK